MQFQREDVKNLSDNQLRRLNELADYIYREKTWAEKESDLRKILVNIGSYLITIAEDN